MKDVAEKNSDQKPCFYVSVHKKGDHITNYSISTKLPTDQEEIQTETTSEETANVMPEKASLDFHTVLGAFVSVMDSYLRFASITLGVVPLLSNIIAEQKIAAYVKEKGREIAEHSNEDTKVYELDIDCFHEFKIHSKDAVAALDGAKQLPEIMVMGLVSSYDAFLTQLLKVVFNQHEEIILTSDKEIKFSDLSKFSSIEEARTTLIDKEIESVIRMSHHEQFSWMEKRLAVKLKEDLPVWPRFVEIFERRNLLTHTGGIVSAQYVSIGREQKFDISKIKVGEKLPVDINYFNESVAVIYEVGVKLCYVLWRKFLKEEQHKADSIYNDVCYNLMYHGFYKISEPLLSFGSIVMKKFNGKQQTRLMMVVNLANSILLQKRNDEARKIIDQEDWSAAGMEFKIGAASVKGDIRQVLDLMQQAGKFGPITAQQYRSWPLFRGIKNDKEFTAVFEDIFGEPFITTKAVDVGVSNDTPTSSGETVH